MLRQPQLHSSITRAHVHVCAPHYLQSATRRIHMLAHTRATLQLPWATEAWALGCGMPCLRWRRRMMTADSSQCDTPKNWPHPHSPSPPVSFTLSLVLPSPHISLHASPSFSPSPMHADCGPIIALAPVLIALHLWKSFLCICFYLAVLLWLM